MTDACMTNYDLRPKALNVTSSLAFDTIPIQRWQPSRRAYSEEIEKRELLNLTVVDFANVAVLPGEAATVDAINREKARDALIELVQRFYSHGLSWNAEGNVKISSHTANSATEFIRLLPSYVALPRISPDGEDGLLMAWECSNNLVIAVLDGRCIHLVSAATTPHAQYLDDIPFDGKQIPDKILKLLPAR